MSLSPDQSRFTACVIGEATPAEQASFDATLLGDASLREEAVTLSRTAHRLTNAMKYEVPVTLTLSQRHRVLQQSGVQAVAPLRAKGWPGWVTPTLATAGIAAAIALGVYPSSVSQSEIKKSSPETVISTVAIQPRAAPKLSARSIAPPPVVVTGATVSTMPDATFPEIPAHSERRAEMAVIPPIIRGIPSATPPTDEVTPVLSPSGKPLPNRSTPSETLASPGQKEP